MGLLFSAIATLIIGLTLSVNPGKLVKNIQAKADTNANVTASGSITAKNKSADADLETDEKFESNTSANATGDSTDEKEEKDEKQDKAIGHVKISVFNNRSGKVMKPFIPKVAVDHSGSLDFSGNVTIGVEEDK